MDNEKIREIALRQSACDCSCSPEDFLAEENRFFPSAANEKARKYLELPHICSLVSYGVNIVISGQAALLPDIRKVTENVPEIENCFETPGLYALNDMLKKYGAGICFMSEYFLPDMKEIFRYERTCACELRVLEQPALADLYLPEWKNALCADRKHLDVLAVGAYDRGGLVGLAGCSADCDTMWQIGVDTQMNCWER